MASAKQYDLAVDGLNDVLRAFRKLPKEASAELRKASQEVADRHMVPAWRNAALYGAGPWGPKIAQSVRSRRDRIPAIQIGGNKRVFRGGATATMVRWPSDTGEGRGSWAPFEATGWIGRTRSYQPAAIREWSQAVDRTLRNWDGI